MGFLTFKGGVHPYDGKELSKNYPIEKYLPRGEMVFPLSQHIGAPAVPVVKKGDRVLAGQLIAEAGTDPFFCFRDGQGDRTPFDTYRKYGKFHHH